MLDQSFSANNFEVIFTLENRKGRVDITTMSKEYQDTLAAIKEVKSQISIICRKRKTERTYDEVSSLESLKARMKELKKEKSEALIADMGTIATEVNSSKFSFEIDKHLYGGKEEFTLKESRAAYYAMKQLLHNMKRTFKIEMSGRHQIMTSLKPLLNMKMPIYIIRTDISSFFESIPQTDLVKNVCDNNLLSYKSKSFIKGLLAEYERIKDTSLTQTEKGIPRGIGVSSMLSEIYMQDVDKVLKSRPEVIFYERYVDDIFMILTSLGKHKSLNQYYGNLQAFFQSKKLELKPIGSEKCKLISYSPSNAFSPISFDYLGYKLILDKPQKFLVTQYALSNDKKLRIKERIDKAFTHFETMSKKNVKIARRDLLDSLNYISGNYRLSNSKKHAKAGLYYSNDLVDDPAEFAQFTDYLHAHAIRPYDRLFSSIDEKQKFILRLQKRILKIDFESRWKSKKMYDFPISRIKEISSWL